MAIGDVYRVSYHGLLFSQSVQFGWHFKLLQAGSNPANLAPNVDAALTAAIQAATSSSLTLPSITVESVVVGGPETITYALAGPPAGGIAGDALPPQDAAVISLHTGFRGKRYRGRYFVPGLAEANIASGLISGAQLTNLQALQAAFDAAFASGGTDLHFRAIVYSPENLTAVPPRVGTLKTDVTYSVVDTIVRTQRRRQLGRGI